MTLAGMSGVERADVQRWVDAYERAWAVARNRSARRPVHGRRDVPRLTLGADHRGPPGHRPLLEAGRDGPDEPFTMSSEIVAVDAEAVTAVVRLAVDYHAEDRRRWRDPVDAIPGSPPTAPVHGRSRSVPFAPGTIARRRTQANVYVRLATGLYVRFER
jgi:hypothetical protein